MGDAVGQGASVKEAGENAEEEARGSTREKKGLNAASDRARKRTASRNIGWWAGGRGETRCTMLLPLCKTSRFVSSVICLACHIGVWLGSVCLVTSRCQLACLEQFSL